MLDAECRVLESSPVALEQRTRVRVHVGTKEVMARVVVLDAERLDPGAEGLVQLRLEERTAAQRLDRYVIRRYSPQITIGGGRLLDTNPRKHRRRHLPEVVGSLEQLGDDREEQVVLRVLARSGVTTFDGLLAKTSLTAERLEDVLGVLGVDGELIELEARGERHLCSKQLFADFAERLAATLEAYHRKNPLRAGAKRGEALFQFKKEIPDFVLRHFVELAISDRRIDAPGGDLLALYGFEVRLTKKQRAALERIERALEEGGFQPPDLTTLAEDNRLDERAARQLVQVLVDRDAAVNVEGKIYFHASVVERGVRLLADELEQRGEMTMSELRQVLGTTRKYSLPLINLYDNVGATTRRGDVRVAGPRLDDLIAFSL